MIKLFLVTLVLLAGFAFGQTDPWILEQTEFTGLATQILTYLGYAVVAGLAVLVAVKGARRAWTFLRTFF
jgi:hypothetical protein